MLKIVMRLDVFVTCFYMHARRVVSRLDDKEHRPLSGYALYESLLTYVAKSGSRRKSASRYLPCACVQDSLLRFVRYST
jgi:hypothetical protein